MKDNILIGKIVRAHGIKGGIVIHSMSSVPEDFVKYGDVFYENGEVVNIKVSKKLTDHTLLCFINGLCDRNSSESIVGKNLYIKRSNLPAVKEDEYYLWQLNNLSVVNNEDKGNIGTILQAEDYGAGTFFTIKDLNGNIFTLPFTNDSVLKIDLNDKKIFINVNFLIDNSD